MIIFINISLKRLFYIYLTLFIKYVNCNGANEMRDVRIHMQAFIKQRRGHNRLGSTLANKVEQG